MTTVVLFHPVLGIRQGTREAAERLRAEGHEVVVPDIFEGRTFEDYGPAMSYAWEELGQAEMVRRAEAATADVPDGFVAAGFSLGCVLAAHLATTRPVTGVLMLSGAIPVSMFGDGRTWPAGVPAQTHSSVDDPWREQDEVDMTVRDVEAGGGFIEVFDYPGAGHLFADPSLPVEYDSAAAELMWSRVLPFVASCA